MDWNIFLKDESEKQYFLKLQEKIIKEREQYIIYPKEEFVFNAFKLTPFDSIKVIILSQDPYHGPNQAMGLAFSVNNGVKVPPSLKNIFKEIEDDLGIQCDKDNGNLIRWARQGVFLLNTTLTVRQGEPNSHQKYGWKFLTGNALSLLNKDDKPKVFMLFGKESQKLDFIITNKNHLIIKAAHPSPLSAYRGFFGCKAFSEANDFLIKYNREPIDWR